MLKKPIIVSSFISIIAVMLLGWKWSEAGRTFALFILFSISFIILSIISRSKKRRDGRDDKTKEKQEPYDNESWQKQKKAELRSILERKNIEIAENVRRQLLISYFKEILPPKRNKLLDSILDGYEFESFVANILRSNGFINVNNTPKSGDYGVDVLAEKDGIKHAIQCKLYSNPVGTSAIQEAATGKSFYNAHVAIVATNSTFTSNAIEMANKVGVVLWDRNKILSMQPEPQCEDNGIEIEVDIDNLDELKMGPVFQEQLDAVMQKIGQLDSLYIDIVMYSVERRHISTPDIMRKFNMGYARTAKIVDAMEENKIVGPYDGTISRRVLMRI